MQLDVMSLERVAPESVLPKWQATKVTNTLAIFARLHDKSKVHRNILIVLSTLRVEEVDLLAL
jgi:hypothetical protein